MSLDYTNSIPLHVQLKQKIEQKIYNGHYEDKIPSERELMDEYINDSTSHVCFPTYNIKPFQFI